MKDAQRLAAEGFVDSLRGRSGGVKLAKPAETMNVGSIVRIMEEMGSFVECLDAETNRCVVTSACGLRHALNGAVEAFLRHLDGFTLSDLIADQEAFRLLLEPS